MENDLLRWFRATLPSHKQLVLGAGDDAAVIQLTEGKQLVATTDMLMDGIDFRVPEHEPAEIGHKALAVNLSDLAAMAARPVAALVSLCLPRDGGEALAKGLYTGILATAARYNVALAGGDTNSWDGPLVISVTALGEVQPGREWRRSGARPGDLILVTGSFGGSILGSHHMFQPLVNEALWLADHLQVHAAIDVSDGLSLDLARLAEASGVGACIHLDRVPISEAAKMLTKQRGDGVTPLEHALGDGEDFQLILAVDADEAERFFAEHPQWRDGLTSIGRFCAAAGLWSVQGAELTPLVPRGWEHRLDP
jgi:thiamine-monophosphate kinase